MADFLSNLWESVFTSGPTPTLLLATNASFACLQALLFALLIATYSIHFVILSLLCGGLWYAINWFAAELQAAQLKEEEAERLRKRGSKAKVAGDGEEGDDEGEDTEVEGEALKSSRASLGGGMGEGVDERVRQEVVRAAQASGIQAPGEEDLRQRSGKAQAPAQVRSRSGDLSGEISTDSEWEKVDEDR